MTNTEHLIRSEIVEGVRQLNNANDFPSTGVDLWIGEEEAWDAYSDDPDAFDGFIGETGEGVWTRLVETEGPWWVGP